MKLRKGQRDGIRARIVSRRADLVRAGRHTLAGDLQEGRGLNRRQARRAIYGDDRSSMLAAGREKKRVPVKQTEDDKPAEDSPLQVVTAAELLAP